MEQNAGDIIIDFWANKKCYPTKEQKEWVAYLNEVGYYAKVVKGFEECQQVIDDYLENRL